MARPEKTAIPETDRNAPAVGDELLRQFIGYNMKRTFLVVREDMHRVLEPLGLKVATFSVLSVVVENPDISQSQLAQALKLERSGMVVLVDALENDDHISRNRVPGDRRTYALRATPKGRRLWEKARTVVEAHEEALFGAVLNEEERALLLNLLQRVSHAL
ncbi:MarR family winged helix-turn-helix transcriptional regulator [Martelella radicis]|uniref:DNA-binding MarR family transcriptional regulator n=1 Tax=Martelella radicis TaxID=1397476 RepID=A0A7W6KMZ0_9HYPH|nr:MarR family transcriptional regulator [Martelella radicis]MBB4124125.1 DNA-binding MarR family transcriptional regulator [Martelella radicis]